MRKRSESEREKREIEERERDSDELGGQPRGSAREKENSDKGSILKSDKGPKCKNQQTFGEVMKFTLI